MKYKCITAVRLRRKQRNENVDTPYLIKQSVKQLPLTLFLADKMHDSEKNHEIAEKCGAKFVVPLRNQAPIHRTHGRHRKQLRRQFPDEIYRKRVLIESIFSALKRRYGDIVYAKKFVSQKNELLCRVLTYNIEKIVNLFIIEIYFLQGRRHLLLFES